MAPLTPLNARIYSKLGQRGSFSLAIEEVAAQDEELVVMTADLTTLTGLTRFKEKYPGKFLNIGIAEQNMICLAAGMAKEGKNVFVTTYANFLAMRAYEQIRIQLGYMQFPVRVIGTGSGLAMGMSGNTHYGIEDIALMRAVPGLMVVSPADGAETTKVIHEAAHYPGPVYVRLSGVMNTPIVYTEEYPFAFGKAVRLREGDDVAVIATGTMVHESIRAAELLKEKGISASVLNMHTIKPLDTAAIRNACTRSNLIVTVEEHSIIGGLGSAVAECISETAGSPRLLRIGIPDAFQKVGDYRYLLEQNGLSAPQIAEKISITFGPGFRS
ncbi:transketolase C-terminal domain-containing protein [Methanoregula sp.]|uniref:transketolase family protein n=1 Tax=Methanoregula sp. TaxID=2052170 RepID=UPI0023703B4B|nr:transketolase C-terminal domain-containing protein [Methanoregula sp.]MDD1687190.1 transketolase family protein [Methanoregula sp.]